MTTTDGQMWVLIISSVFAGLTGLITLVFQQLNNRDTIIQRNRVEVKVDKAVAQTNAALGEGMRQAMISAHLLANQTKSPEHIKLAKESEAAYLRHQAQMEQSARIQSPQ